MPSPSCTAALLLISVAVVRDRRVVRDRDRNGNWSQGCCLRHFAVRLQLQLSPPSAGVHVRSSVSASPFSIFSFVFFLRFPPSRMQRRQLSPPRRHRRRFAPQKPFVSLPLMVPPLHPRPGGSPVADQVKFPAAAAASGKGRPNLISGPAPNGIVAKKPI